MSEANYAVIEDVARELFGDAVDPRELYDVISKQNDASEMHVVGPMKPKKDKKIGQDISQIPGWQKNVALATNAAGVVAGPAAIALATRAALKNEGGIPREGVKAAASDKMPRPVRRAAVKTLKFFRNNKKAAVAAGVTGVGLQVANMTGDAISTRAFAGQRAKEKKFAEQRRKNVKKALEDIVDARRRGVINTETAIRMSSDLIEKAVDRDGIINEAAKIIPKTTLKPKKIKPLKAPRQAQDAVQAPALSPVVKSGPDITWQGTISKMDTEKRQVFGYATVTHVNGQEVVDLQGDYVPLDEIEKAAYTYVIDSRKGGDMHQRAGEKGEIPLHTSDMIESFVVTPEKLEKMGLPADAVPHGWWVGFKVNDDAQWEKVKSGERTGFSIHGSGRRIEKMVG